MYGWKFGPNVAFRSERPRVSSSEDPAALCVGTIAHLENALLHLPLVGVLAVLMAGHCRLLGPLIPMSCMIS